MSEYAFKLDVTFDRATCSECGIPFAAPVLFFTKRRESHATFYCPNGHAQYFPAETDAESYRKQLADESERHQRTIARLNASEKHARKLERVAKRTHARITQGVCPCCNRTFVNLARHMATKHPDEIPQRESKPHLP